MPVRPSIALGAPAIPRPVDELMRTLAGAGHAAYVVGGSLRDALLERRPADWDLTSDAPPERIRALFPRSTYENRFGTVVVHHRAAQYEITTFRSDVSYSDHRHPDAVQFGSSIEEDLARRDFTVNAIAWGGPPGAERVFVDPHGGRTDLERRLLRAVGDPDRRFEEDALRMLRAVRLAATLGFDVEPATLDAVRRHAPSAAALSGERIFGELTKLLAARRPSEGLDLAERTGILPVLSPDLGAQPGMPQNKVAGEDLWRHTLRTVDASPNRRVVRLAAFLHDIGKPATLADGHFIGHEAMGAELSRTLLVRLHAPRLIVEQVCHLVAQHMFSYEPAWSDAAVRRFIRKVGPGSVDDLLALRAADNAGSGLPRTAGNLAALRSRVRRELEAGAVTGRAQLAVDGRDLIDELGLEPGPDLGRLLDDLTDRVVNEPALNHRAVLMELAGEWISGHRAVNDGSR
jgi:tRNA nucleotidyltransferase (CCA-adding enzyme)